MWNSQKVRLAIHRRQISKRRSSKRRCLIEHLDARITLNAAPIAVADPWYATPTNASLTVGTSDTTLLENDWDPEASSISASLVSSPANGTLSTFNADGTFTYVPNTGFSGLDSFTYKVNDGSDDSNVVSASIAVGGDLGVRTNLEESSRHSFLFGGGLQLAEPLTPGFQLVYESNTLPNPIVPIDTSLLSGSMVPDDINAQLTFDGTAGTTFTYSTSGLAAGDEFRIALQTDSSSLSTGRYDYSVELTANYFSSTSSRTFTGSQDVVNRGASTNPFGVGWQLAGLDELVVDSSGALWVQSDGTALWFASDGSGGYLTAEGDLSFSSLVKNVDNTYTLTLKTGETLGFDTGGDLTSFEDRNGNTISYTYTSGLLTSITDSFSRVTTLTYTSGRLTSISDPASRTATLAYDGSGRLTSITQPDPDGTGTLAAPVTSFGYDSSNRLTTRTDALSNSTAFAYGSSHGRLTTITHPDSENIELTAIQTIGLPTATSGNTLAPSNPLGTLTDERDYDSTFRADRYGYIIEWNNQLGLQTLTERNAAGQVVRLIEADPDGEQSSGGSGSSGGGEGLPEEGIPGGGISGSGPLTSPITIFGYDPDGNLVFQENPDLTTLTWTYTSIFHQLASQTDELSRTVSFAYDTNGNLTTSTDAGGFDTTFTYDSRGLVTSTTTPDPDGIGTLTSATTSYAYDSYGRVTTLTNPDTTTQAFAYDSADNLTSDTDELGNVTTIAYDALGRTTSVTDREGEITLMQYDAIGQLTKQTDVLGGETDYTYNERGFVTEILYPDPDGGGSLGRREAGFIYDASGNHTSYQVSSEYGHPLSLTVTYTYDAAGRRTQVVNPEEARNVNYQYDNLGRLISETEPSRLNKEYEYDAMGRVIMASVGELSDETPAETFFEYDAAGQLISITDARGYSSYYEYDVRGLLTRTTLPDPDGDGSMFATTSHYSYDNVGRLTNEYGMYTRVTDYAYDSRNRVTQVTLPDANDEGQSFRPVLTFSYDAVGNALTNTDPLGNLTTYTYDKEGRVKTVTGADPDGLGSLTSPVVSYSYNNAGNVTSVTDANGGITSFQYDNLGRQTQVTGADPDGGGPLTSTITQYQYDDRGNIDKIIDPESRETTFQYDSANRRSGVTDDTGNQTTYAYDTWNNLTSVTGADPDGTGPLTAPVTSFVNDAFGRRTRITDPESGITRFTYDDMGNLLTLTDPENNTTSYAYDGMGRITIDTNQLSDTRSFQYSSEGNLARKVDRNGRITQYTYDNLERMTAESWYVGTSSAPELTVTVDTEGGEINEVQRVGFSAFEAYGTFTLTFGSDTTAALAYDASAATIQSALEALASIGSGNINVFDSTVEYGVGSGGEWTLTFQGTLAGTNVTQTTIDTSGLTGEGITEVEATDTTGAILDEEQTIDLDNVSGGTFRLAFQGETTATIVYNATASTVESELEQLNAVDDVTVTGSAGGPWTVTFVGSHAGTDVPAILGDATAATDGTLDRTISYTYNQASQLTAASDPDSSYAYTYDNLGRLLSVDNDGTGGVPRVILSSAYDAKGNRTALSATIDSTDDFSNSYTYDALNRVTQILQQGITGGNTVAEKRIDLTYNVDGRYDSITRFNDIAGGTSAEIATSTYSYDSLGRLTGLDYEQASTDLFTPYAWTYDDLNRITQFTSADGTSDFDYDKTGQLTAADHSYQTDESYSYDDNGNRTNIGYATGSDNQLTNDGTYSYEYDDEGNRTRRVDNSTYDETLYEWDFRNHLTKVTEKDSFGTTTQVVQYTYDVFNRRIGKAVDTASPFNMVDAAIERYIIDDAGGVTSVDGGNVVLDFVDPDGDGATSIALERRQLFGNAVDQILAQEDATESISSADRVAWPLVDHLGTVRDLVENDGTLDEHYEYDAFGNVTSGDTTLTRYLYTGRELDTATGLQYNRARWYDPAVGRWLSKDPIGFAAGDANLYRYVNNEIFVAKDPSGLSYWSDVLEVYQGYGDAAVGTVTGIGTMVMHPVQTAQGIGHAIAHPIDTATIVINDLQEQASTPRGQGAIVGDILISVVTGGTVKAVKETGKVAKIVNQVNKALPDLKKPSLKPSDTSLPVIQPACFIAGTQIHLATNLDNLDADKLVGDTAISNEPASSQLVVSGLCLLVGIFLVRDHSREKLVLSGELFESSHRTANRLRSNPHQFKWAAIS